MNSSVSLSRSSGRTGKLCRSLRRIPIVSLLIGIFLPGGPEAIRSGAIPSGSKALAEQRAVLVDGRTVTGQIIGSGPTGLMFDAGDAGRVPLTTVRQVNFGSPPRLVSGPIPPRRIVLRGEESAHVEVEGVTAETVTFTGLGAKSRSVPRRALRAVLQPVGTQLVAGEDFENTVRLFAGGRFDESRHLSGRRSLRLRPGDPDSIASPARPIAAGRIDLSFFDTAARHETDWLIEAEIQGPEGMSRLAFCPGWSAAEYRTVPAGRGASTVPPRARSEGWHRLTLLIGDDRILVLVDDRVVDSQPPGALAALRLRPGKGTGTDRTVAWIDDVQFYEQIEDRPWELNLRKSDLLRLAEGDDLFGEIVAADPNGVELTGRFGRRSFRWTQIRGIEFAAGGGLPGEPVAGLIAMIELAPVLGAGAESCDSLVVAVQSITDSGLAAVHPHLGELRIPLGWIERIVPQFVGTLQLVDAAVHHLGDEIREDFRAKLAEGPRVEWAVSFAAPPPGRASVTLLAADVEPGFGAAQDGRGLQAELAAGFLRTELFVNDRRIDDLNRHVRVRAVPTNPQRLRVPLPAGVLKAGRNTIRLEQRPARSDPQQFDDCEVSRVAIEIEP